MSSVPAHAPSLAARALVALAWIVGAIGIVVAGIGLGRMTAGGAVVDSLGTVAIGVMLIVLAAFTSHRARRL
ncbi:hypothetical protein GXB85_06630 [Cellulomonas sp. APG4]|uniref:hypothetical protein n=1 Tax=Cellulomonas sp. APG4 TaxID=1538656 RepID=UPI00137B71E4|nr:hypothetical protein [Cellulomonas sp. APG4]NCT90618.1 hypothetical protein [Cellulomonas sp. APG4]